jgi:hypothetical protein
MVRAWLNAEQVVVRAAMRLDPHDRACVST